jgi:SAM-dependent methyltransferase
MPPESGEPFREPARHYLGRELELFAGAHRWRAYWGRTIAPFVGARVLEVGAGIGSTALGLWRTGIEDWLAVEPDPLLVERFRERTASLRPQPRVHEGTLASLTGEGEFDTAIYVDVLEHLADDAEEVARAARLLRRGGCFVALSPGHPFLYSPFDKAIGHVRRYTRRGLAELIGRHCTVVKAVHLDSVGALLSLGNRLLLRAAEPTRRQLAFWNGLCVPASRLLDPLVAHRFGRSVLVIGRR